MRWTSPVLIATLLLTLPPLARAQEKKPTEDPEVVAHFKAKGLVATFEAGAYDDRGLVVLSVTDAADKFKDVEVTEESYAVLAKAKGIQALDLNRIKCTDAGLKAVAAHLGIESILVRGDAVTGAGIGALAGAKSLKRVILKGAMANADAGIAELAKLPKLESLRIESVELTGSCFEKFESAKSLRTLELDYTKGVTDEGAKQIAKLKGLTRLQLGTSSGNRLLTTAGLRAIADGHVPSSFSFDRELLDDDLLIALVAKGWLYGPSPPGTTFPRAATAAGVSSLYFVGSPITDKGFAAVLDCKNTSELKLDGTGITDASLLKMGGFKQLKYVHLEKCKVTGKGLAALVDAPIQLIDLRRTELGEDAFRALGNMRDLTYLHVTGAKIDPAGTKYLTASKTLFQYSAAETEFNDAAASELAKISTLAQVTVNGTDLTDKGFAELAKLPKLQSLSLDGKTTKVTKEAYLKAKKDYPKARFYSGPLER